MDNKVKDHLEQQKSVTFNYCGKNIIVNPHTTLSELQELFGFELDVLDIFYANWEVKH